MRHSVDGYIEQAWVEDSSLWDTIVQVIGFTQSVTDTYGEFSICEKITYEAEDITTNVPSMKNF